MKTLLSNPADRNGAPVSFRTVLPLALAGAAVFWIVSFVTSILPLAADYRSAYSNWSAQTVWFGAVFAGLLFGFLVSCVCVRRSAKKPSESPVGRAVLVSAIALAVAILLIDVPLTLQAKQNVLHYFLIGVMFNTIRFLLLGLTVGLIHRRIGRVGKADV